LKFYNVDNFHDNIIEIESYIYSISIKNGVGKEIVMQISDTGIKNKQEFYTDSNGLEL